MFSICMCNCTSKGFHSSQDNELALDKSPALSMPQGSDMSTLVECSLLKATSYLRTGCAHPATDLGGKGQWPVDYKPHRPAENLKR